MNQSYTLCLQAAGIGITRRFITEAYDQNLIDVNDITNAQRGAANKMLSYDQSEISKAVLNHPFASPLFFKGTLDAILGLSASFFYNQSVYQQNYAFQRALPVLVASYNVLNKIYDGRMIDEDMRNMQAQSVFNAAYGVQSQMDADDYSQPYRYEILDEEKSIFQQFFENNPYQPRASDKNIAWAKYRNELIEWAQDSYDTGKILFHGFN